MDPLIVRAKQLAKLLGVSLVTVRRLDAAGKLPKPLRIGGCVAWEINTIKNWLSAGSPPRDKWDALNATTKGSKR